VPNPTSEPAKTMAELNRSKSSTPSWVYYVVGAGTIIAISLIIWVVISLK
jgi:hypothetical protein